MSFTFGRIQIFSDGEWSAEAIERFSDLTWVAQWKVLIAKVRGYKERALGLGSSRREGSPIPCVDLYDKNDNKVKKIVSLKIKILATTVNQTIDKKFLSILVQFYNFSGRQDINIGKQMVAENLAEAEEGAWSAASSTLSLSRRSNDSARSPTPVRSPPPLPTVKKSSTMPEAGKKMNQVSVIEEVDLTVTPQVNVFPLHSIVLSLFRRFTLLTARRFPVFSA